MPKGQKPYKGREVLTPTSTGARMWMSEREKKATRENKGLAKQSGAIGQAFERAVSDGTLPPKRAGVSGARTFIDSLELSYQPRQRVRGGPNKRNN